ncbi:MAG: PrsW family glutamic-type intramembrane protease [Acidimicrobiales bacterium]
MTGGRVPDPPGWYCFSAQPRLAEWDGTVWTGASHAAFAGPVLAGPPAPFAFLRQRWLWWMVVGQALTILAGLLSGSTGTALWSWFSVVGFVAFLGGAVLLVIRYLDLGRRDDLRLLTWIGIVSGVAAFGIGLGLEVACTHVFGWATTLWLAGPVEEGGKLLVPVLLLAFGAPRFTIPRVGLYLVLISGATFGTLEGVEYEGLPTIAWAHLEMGLVRPSVELVHVFLTGFAAAVIWLAAWRRSRVVTGAGVVAFLVVVGIHSFHDGLATFTHVNPRTINDTLARTLGEAISRGVPAALVALVLSAFLYILARHGSRELTDPGDIERCPPPWRPQLKGWGYERPPGSDGAVTIGWSPYGAPAYYGAAGAAGAVPGYGALPSFGAPRSPYAAPAGPAHPGAGTSPVPDLFAPPPAPPGWYVVNGDPGCQGWWSGTAWTAFRRWNGYHWEPV